jgi:hypothetical protein
MLPRPRRAGTALAVTAAFLLVPGAAHAAQPKPGYYEGDGVFFKIAKYGKRPQLFRLSLSGTLTCADGTTRADTLDTILISGPKVSRAGRFRYAAPGVVFKGRFTSRSRASGTLSRTDGDCSASSSWTATRKTAGEPVPQG